ANAPCNAVLAGARVHAGSRDAISLADARSSEGGVDGMTLLPSSHPRTAKAATRQPISNRLRGERIHHEVHGEPCVVDREKALALRVVVPLRAVVFAAVQHRDATVALHSEQMLVHQIVAPAGELVARCRRSV